MPRFDISVHVDLEGVLGHTARHALQEALETIKGTARAEGWPTPVFGFTGHVCPSEERVATFHIKGGDVIDGPE